MRENKIIIASAIAAFAIVFASLAFLLKPISQTFASVSQGSDYIATTTGSIAFASPTYPWRITATSSTDRSSYVGTFGSFIQTTAGSAGGSINCYDATTTASTQRWPQATSSLLLASLPTNAAVGVYTFDVRYFRGILCTIDGTPGTTTITWR